VRNKDSAMKSRVRKKLYVKDLEMKSKYLEAECCRLNYALQCCSAENLVLRQCLLKDRPVVPTAMQESAVLMGKIYQHMYFGFTQCIIHTLVVGGISQEHFSSFFGDTQDKI
jgi:hypothetical protein